MTAAADLMAVSVLQHACDDACWTSHQRGVSEANTPRASHIGSSSRDSTARARGYGVGEKLREMMHESESLGHKQDVR
jgi:hypothetical protein